MSRIATLSANQNIVRYMMQNQELLNTYNAQLATYKVSQTYSGISTQSSRLVTAETAIATLATYVDNNIIEDIRLDIAGAVVEGITSSIEDFRSILHDYESADTTEINIAYVQESALRALTDIEAYLNTEADGRYIFAGSQVTTTPVDFGITSLANFQEFYDGMFATYPTTRDAHLASYSMSADANAPDAMYVDVSNWLSFTQDSDGDTTTSGSGTITAPSDMFSSVEVGGTIVVSGTDSGLNDGSYTVTDVSSDGRTVTVTTTMLTDETVNTVVEELLAPATITLEDLSTILPAASGSLAFTQPNTITAATATSLASVPVGETITISGSGSNDGTYVVATNDGTTLTLETVTLTAHDGTTTIAPVNLGDLTFDRAANTITSNITDAFAALSAGESFTISGSQQNDGTYTIASNDGTTITIETNKFTDEGLSSGTTFYDYTVGTELDFDSAAGTIVAQDYAGNAIAGAFSDLQVGDSFVIANSPSNDGTYTVGSISTDGSTITVNTGTPLAATETDGNGTDITMAGRNFAFMTGTELVLDDQGAAGGGDDTIQVLNQSTGLPDTNALQGITAGMTIALSGTGYDGSYLVTAVDATTGTLTIDDSTPIDTGGIAVTETPVSPATFSMVAYGVSGSIESGDDYYYGDTVLADFRVEEGRSISVDYTPLDPAFEKAIRAMGIIAQGVYGTAGGLDQNWDRLDDALYLLDDALGAGHSSDAPYGTEAFGNVQYVLENIIFDQLVLTQTNTRLETLIGTHEQTVTGIEDIDELEVATQLLAQKNAVEASYEALSTVLNLSLIDYL